MNKTEEHTKDKEDIETITQEVVQATKNMKGSRLWQHNS